MMIYHRIITGCDDEHYYPLSAIYNRIELFISYTFECDNSNINDRKTIHYACEHGGIVQFPTFSQLIYD